MVAELLDRGKPTVSLGMFAQATLAGERESYDATEEKSSKNAATRSRHAFGNGCDAEGGPTAYLPGNGKRRLTDESLCRLRFHASKVETGLSEPVVRKSAGRLSGAALLSR